MLDWLLWPSDLLLSAGGMIASLFISKDAPSFVAVQMVVATMVLAAIVCAIVCAIAYAPSLLRYLRSIWRTPATKHPSKL
jgi:threonine/homoserine/homoserine lactone efflux protein